MRYSIILLVAAILLNTLTQAADWPCWRGPDGLGISSERNLPVRWSKENNVAWHVPLPGRGVSSPVVVGDRVYLTTQTEDTGLHALAIDRKSGRTIWDRKIGAGKLKTNEVHNMATPTPIADGKHIWVQFGTGDLACLDLEGNVVWQRNLQKDHGEYKIMWGMGTSPMMIDDKLYVACMHAGPSYLLAMDAQTGKDVWKKDRNVGGTDEAQDSYSSPVILQTDSGPRLIVSGANHINAYDPATGHEYWSSGGLNVPHPYGRTISSPTVGEGLIVTVASGFRSQGFVVGIKPGGRGDVTNSHWVWKNDRVSPDCPTPLIYNGFVFLIRDVGVASCLNLATGKSHWEERLFSSNVKVSPVAGDGKIYFTDNQGNCKVVRATNTFELLANNELNDETLSTPSISNGNIFIRTYIGLYCIGKS